MSTFKWARDMRLSVPESWHAKMSGMVKPLYNTFEILGAIEIVNPKSRETGEIIRFVGKATALQALNFGVGGVDMLNVFLVLEQDNGELRVDNLGMHDAFRDRFRAAQVGEQFKYRRIYEKVDPTPFLSLIENKHVMGEG